MGIVGAGKPISETIFFQEKCKCVAKSDLEECACPICTQMSSRRSGGAVDDVSLRIHG